MTNIGTFKDFKELTSIYLLGKNPPSVSENCFTESQYVNITLYVPAGSLKTYQNADIWNFFWNIQEKESTVAIKTQPTAENLQIELTPSEVEVKYQWYQYVERKVVYSKDVIPASFGPFAWTESNKIWTSGNRGIGQSQSVMTATIDIQKDDTISFDYTVPKGDGNSSSGSQWFQFTINGSGHMFTFGGNNEYSSHYDLSISDYWYKYKDASTITIGFECVRNGNSDHATVSNIKHIRPTGFTELNGLVDEIIVGATTEKLDESLFEKGNIVYCVVTLPNGKTLISDKVRTIKDDTGIEEVVFEPVNGYTVYTIYGTFVMRTMEKSNLDKLPTGIYIINGKKLIVK